MKLSLLTFILTATALTTTHAALNFPPATITTSKGITCEIKVAKTDKELNPAVKLLQRQFGKSTVLHRADDQEICAYLAGKQLAGVLKIEIPTKRRPYVYITHFSVDKNHRNKGIGSSLLTYLFEHTAYPIELCSENKAAARLYRKLGFVTYDAKDHTKMRKEK